MSHCKEVNAERRIIVSIFIIYHTQHEVGVGLISILFLSVLSWEHPHSQLFSLNSDFSSQMLGPTYLLSELCSKSPHITSSLSFLMSSPSLTSCHFPITSRPHVCLLNWNANYPRNAFHNFCLWNRYLCFSCIFISRPHIALNIWEVPNNTC